MNLWGGRYVPSAEHKIGSEESFEMIAFSTGPKKESWMFRGIYLNQVNLRFGRILNLLTASRNAVEMASRSVTFHGKSDRMSSLLVEVRKSA